jgi:dipeptidyl aminopeptidase/acylaminoacyl peptidase
MPSTQDYQAAEQLLRRPARPGELVVGDRVRPRWIDGGARFWYSVSDGVGRRFVVVDPAAGTRAPAFDHSKLASALDEEVLWYSQRDGWGHLYRYDLRTGELLGQVTSGRWAVRQILHVDEAERVMYFMASGLVEDDPYRRTVCRVGLDGSGFSKVTDDELDHVVTMPGSMDSFVDSASTVDTPPVTTVRDRSGRVLVELERADITKLAGTGWTPPERFCVEAADGETDIYGVLYRPRGFDPAQRYPVVDTLYPGPQVERVTPSFDPGGMGLDAEPLAALGFVVVAIDGRGTPGRSKSFHDASYGHLADAGSVSDHVAALRQLSRTRPWMDMDRIGAFGHSGGGFAAVRAMLDFPEVYTTGVALSGPHDARYFNLGFVEAYDGADDPEAWARASNVDLADRLAGDLLLVHGEMDDQVHPDHTLRLADRLIAANKDFEMGLPRAEADGDRAARLPSGAHPDRSGDAGRDVRLIAPLPLVR